MLSFNVLVLVCLLYAAALFIVAAVAERQAAGKWLRFLKSPLIYTLSISVYCTAWTFYGAVGSAARSGFDFLAIYLGPTLVFIGWWLLLRKLVRIGRTQRITSIADLISSRYGKSNLLGVMVTILAVIASTPYIALQLQSLTLSFAAFSDTSNSQDQSLTALILASGLAAFTIVFGTRNLDANERHHGIVTAIALEAIVKLVALVSVGVFVVWFVADGPKETIVLIEEKLPLGEEIFDARWATIMFLSASAIICLPRMFQVVVVENSAEEHLRMASWAFPLYLFLMCLFVMPIAAAGLDLLPAGSNPDLFVLTIPLHMGQETLATLAFLGGFSSATSMVIVAAVALSTMVSNQIVLPAWLYFFKTKNPASDDVRSILLRSRRVSIAGVLALGYFYYSFTSGSAALASIGLIAFLGVAQVLPELVGGLYWRSATRLGAVSGISIGFIVWAYTLFLPSFEGRFILSQDVLSYGPFGLEFLIPNALFGVTLSDPLVHALFWSISLNILTFVCVSLASTPKHLERLQAVQFINVFGHYSKNRTPGQATSAEDLFILAQRVLGRNDAVALFAKIARQQGKSSGLPDPSSAFIETLERAFAGSVGAATAHAMLVQITGYENVSVDELIAVADETAQIKEYSARLEQQSQELTDTADQLLQANQKLTEVGIQKDSFLSQVSHELRTPMTAIRSFSEILKGDQEVDPGQIKKFSGIIHKESQRLTRLLDEILDLSFLESGKVKLNISDTTLGDILDQSFSAMAQLIEDSKASIIVADEIRQIPMRADVDRMSQVFINLFSNSIKYSDKEEPKIWVLGENGPAELRVFVEDNGPGIPMSNNDLVFEKFARLSSAGGASGVGLGLSISREIMRSQKGDLRLVHSTKGARFELSLPASTLLAEKSVA